MAEKKKHIHIRGAKQPSKRLEGDLIGRSRDLAENPGLLRPMCAGNCRKCVFDKVFKDIDKYQQYRGDEKSLLKLASRGLDSMARAYAGTISIEAAGKVPLMATAVIAGERVPYVVRGSVPAPLLIGCQHYDDPKLRLLYYNGLIKKQGLHLYSWEDKAVCSDSPNMPEDYLYDTWWETPYKFEDDGIECGHEGNMSLNIRIKSNDNTVHICSDCAKDVSTLMYLVSRLSAADPLDDFEVWVQSQYHSENDNGKHPITGDQLKQYMVGKVTDRALIESFRKSDLTDLAASGSLTLISGEKNYGSDLDSFLADLSGPEEDKKLLKAFLSANPRSVVVKSGRTAEALQSLWEKDWKGLIAAATSAEFAERYAEKPGAPMLDALGEARMAFMSKDVVEQLPEFTRPGPMTQMADTLAKAAKVGGLPMVRSTAEKLSYRDSKSKGLAAGFRLACGDTETGFNFTKDEQEFAEFLVPFIKQVIASSGNKYREDMNTLLMALSCGEKV
jgi:hypothetical protein